VTVGQPAVTHQRIMNDNKIFMANEAGDRIILRGYAAIFNVKSDDPRFEGRHDLIKPGAFDDFLRRYGNAVFMEFAHCGAVGRVMGNLKLWTDRVGLAFEFSDIPANKVSAYVVCEITSGRTRGMSWGGEHYRVVENIGGEKVNAITEICFLDHISPTPSPAYSGTGVWTADCRELPDHVALLRAQWDSGRFTAHNRSRFTAYNQTRSTMSMAELDRHLRNSPILMRR
jgi:HK97 family phage prohead protease